MAPFGARKLVLTGVGFAVALGAVLLIGEAYARLWPPRDVREHFGQGAPRSGIYRPDAQLGADYRSYDEFRSENAARLAALGPFASANPTWLFFGNSFAQAPGMMADTARRMRPDRRIFNLGRNVDLHVRAAQARQLLAAGLKPERIFFVLLPLDAVYVGRRPLSFIAVSPEGAITTRPRWPDPPWTAVVRDSRLAAIAWLRSGRADGDPGFDSRKVAAAPSARVRGDLARILAHLAETSRRYGVPVTIVVLPNREQIFGREGFGFQDAMRELSRDAGFDFYDARAPLVEVDDKRGLFLPDWHFNERGNTLVMQALLVHLRNGASQASCHHELHVTMSFAQIEFAYFLPIAFGVWLLIRRNYRAAVAWLLVASLVFYGLNHWWMLPIIIAYCLIDWSTGLWLKHTSRPLLVLALGVGFNLLILSFWKYTPLLLETAAELTGCCAVPLKALTPGNWLVPMGISFYAFTGIAYMVDVYRGTYTR